MDERPVVTAASPPPPISGGTMIVTSDARLVVAADPDRDQIYVVDIVSKTPQTIALPTDSEPGRVHEDAVGRVHALLRRSGKLVTLDLAGATIAREIDVCTMPRGIDDDPVTDTLYVACAGGEVVSVPGAGGDRTAITNAGAGLRDVVVQNGILSVSRFKSAEILRVDPAAPSPTSHALAGISRLPIMADDVDTPMDPAGAWRMVDGGSGSLLVLHQYGLAGPVQLDPHGDQAGGPFPDEGTPYGGNPGGCSGIVASAVSEVAADGSVRPGVPLSGAVLTVDAAVSPDGQWIAMVSAGAGDPESPQPVGSVRNLVVTARSDLTTALGSAQFDPNKCQSSSVLQSQGQAIAVAFNPSLDPGDGTAPWIVVQSRQPAQLLFFRSMADEPVIVPLSGSSVYDTGHEIFHRDAGSGIACASCHLEGAEDGRVWHFDPIGPRRTQALHVGLRDTEPFHWDGDMPDFSALMNEVFVRRMGGAIESTDRLTALSEWLFQLTPPTPQRAADDAAVVRGGELFAAQDVGCATCHAGSKLTSTASQFVGTTEPGHALQVPSLVGIGHRAPFIHTGCAATLADRFDPACGGGDAHGHTSQLSGAEIDDLVAYLESL